RHAADFRAAAGEAHAGLHPGGVQLRFPGPYLGFVLQGRASSPPPASAAGRNSAAYVPDLPGRVATGETVEETERLLREAIELHVAGCARTGRRCSSRRLSSITLKFP